MPRNAHTFLNSFFAIFILISLVFPPQITAFAAGFSVTPITWNVMGLDSNNVNVGPNHFPVGARVCNNTGATANNVTASFIWDSTNAYVNNRAGTNTTLSVTSLTSGACTDFYFEVEITRIATAYNTTRRYHIAVTSTETGASVYSTTTPREVFVEHLVSQSRNAVTDVQYGTSLGTLTSVAAGGTMALVVGGTYYIKLIGFTATQGYEQLESFINFPNTIFQTLSVSTTYTADTSAYVASPNDKAYADACKWESDPNSPNYRACLDVGKNGGDITVTYQVKILQVPSAPLVNPEPLSTLIYDFSGSSYHYNADYGISTRYAYVLDPSSITISKNFSPDPTNAGGISALTFTLTNPTPVTVSGLNFTDTFPTSPGAMVVASTPGASTAGCGTPTFTAVAGAASVSFSNGTLAPNSSCTATVNVTVPVTGVYSNTSTHLFIDTLDTTHFASDTVTVNSTPAVPAPPSICTTPVTLATWSMPTSGQGSGGPPPPYTTKASDVATAVASYTTVSGSQFITAFTQVGPPVIAPNAWGGTAPTGGDGWNETASSMANYFQFQLDTSNYGGVFMSFDGRPDNAGDWANPNSNVFINTQANSGAFTAYTPVPLAAKNAWTSITTTSVPTGTATTTFRIGVDGSGNNKTGAIFYLDNVVFMGCPRLNPPTITKAFSPSPIAVNGVSTLTFTLTNPNPSNALTGVTFTDTLPSGIQVAATPTATTTCGGTPTWAPSAGATSLTFGSPTGASIPLSGSCTVSVNVTATAAGPYQNVSGFVSSTNGGTNTGPTGSASASLTVIKPPTIAKAFAANPILAGGTSTLTFTITNPNQNDSISGVGFTDTFPTSPGAMTVASPLTTMNTCGGSLQDNLSGALGAGDLGIKLITGSLTGGSTCTISVKVTAPTAGSYVNTSGNVSHVINAATVNGNTASDTLTVNSPNPAIALLKQVSTSASGPWSSFLSVTASTNVYYQFTVENTGDVPLSPISLTDGTLNVSSCNTTWSALTLQVADALDNDHIATCVIGPISAVSGTHTNTATATGTYLGVSHTSTSSAATYATPSISIDKTATQTYFVVAGDVLNYSYLISNTGFVPLVGPVTVTDNKASVTCPTVDSVGDSDAYLDPGESITCTATYTVTAADITAGFVTNVAHATVGGVDSPTDTVTVPRQLPDLTVTKTNNTSNIGVISTPYTWIVTMANTGVLDAVFANGQTLLSDPLPAGPAYGSPTAGNFTSITNSANISCSINGSNILTCTASGASVTLVASTGSFQVSFSVTPASSGSLANTATVDPNNSITESNESNNTGFNTVIVLSAPSISKNFSPDPIAVGGVSTLTFTISNANTGTALSGVAFTDSLPAGLEVAATPNVSISGCGSPTFAPTAGNTSLTFSGGSIVASGTCTVTVDVTATTSGTKNNTSGNVSSTNAGTGNTASDSLTVLIAPSISKNFSPDPISVGGVSTLTFTISNANTGAALTGVAFTDSLPAGLEVAATPNVSTSSCGSPTFAPAATNTSLTFSGGSIAASSTCIVTVDVTATTSGTKNNTSSNVTSTNAGTGNTASDSLTVLIAPSISKNFSPDPIAVGGVSALTFTISNANTGTALTGVAFTDSLPAGLEVAATPNVSISGCGSPTFTPAAGNTSLTFSSASIAASGTCTVTVDVTATTSGTKNNTSSNVTSTNAGTGNTASNSLTVLIAPSISKNFSPDPIAIGGVSTLTFTISNANTGTALTGVAFTDSFPAGLEVAATPNVSTSSCGSPTFTPAAGNTSLTFSSASIAASATCTVTVDVTATTSGTKNNTTGNVISTNAGTGNTASDSLTVNSGIDAVDDDYSATPVNGYSGGNAGNAFSNDTLNAVAVNPADITATVVTPASVPGVTLDTATGSVDVAANTPAGTYTIDYKICENLNPTNCDTARITVQVDPPVIDAVDDDYSATPVNGYSGGNAGNAFSNDTLNAVAVNPADITATVVTPASVPGVTLDTATGSVDVAANTPAGTYTIDYKICENLNPTNCDTARITVQVDPPVIDAVDDDYSATPVNGYSGGNAGNAFSNDTLNAVAVNPADITATVVTPASVPGVTLDTATGSVDVAANTPAGTYTIDYKICENLNPTNCDTARITVQVDPPVIDAVDDSGSTVDGTAGGTSLVNVLTNDSLNGTSPVLLANVNLTQVSTTNAGVTLDVSDGSVDVAAGTAAGNYTVTYQICDKLNPTVCDTATVSVPVVGIKAVNDTGVAVNGTTGGISVANVLTNDTVSGVTATISNVNLTLVGVLPAGILLNTSTGEVSVATGTPAGMYAFDYQICDKLNTTVCDTATVSVPVSGIFDPPTATKTFNAAGLPELEFRMVWINSGNVFAINTQVTDGIPTGTTYVPASIVCEPRGSSSNAVTVSSPLSNTAVPNQSCGFDAGNNRIQWQGNIGPDNGNLTEATADNEVVISFRVTVGDGVNQVQNQGFSRTDVDADANFDEETVLGTSLISSNQVVWNRSSSGGQSDSSKALPRSLPATGFAPGVITSLPTQSTNKQYSSTDLWLEIPRLGIDISIVGVPLTNGQWDLKWLSDQAGWLDGTAFPSWKGNSVLTSHVYLPNGKPGPFVNLSSLKFGDSIIVHAYGEAYTYIVQEDKIISPNDTSVLGHKDDAWVTLLTCKTYNESTKTYDNRVAVQALLVSVKEDRPSKTSDDDRK